MYLVRLDESTYWFIHLISLSLVAIPSICLFACIVYVIHFSRLIFFTIVHFPVSNHSNAKGGCFAFMQRDFEINILQWQIHRKCFSLCVTWRVNLMLSALLLAQSFSFFPLCQVYGLDLSISLHQIYLWFTQHLRNELYLYYFVTEKGR